jgi:valyl-tRNA synthetase
MPFLTEELYEQVGGSGRMLITSAWPIHDAVQVDAAAAAEMDWVIRLISEIRAVRAEMNVPPAAELTMLMRDASAASRARLETHIELIRRLARLDKVAVDGATPPNGAVQLVVDEATVMLPLAGVIDVTKERARLTKDIDKLAGEASKIESKLANAQFAAKAPPEVIEEQRDRLAELQQTVARLASARDRLSAM